MLQPLGDLNAPTWLVYLLLIDAQLPGYTAVQKGMKLSAAQRAQLAMVHLIVRADMDRLRQERAEILISLSVSPAAEHLAVVELLTHIC